VEDFCCWLGLADLIWQFIGDEMPLALGSGRAFNVIRRLRLLQRFPLLGSPGGGLTKPEDMPLIHPRPKASTLKHAQARPREVQL
jgi:hypothetical protein